MKQKAGRTIEYDALKKTATLDPQADILHMRGERDIACGYSKHTCQYRMKSLVRNTRSRSQGKNRGYSPGPWTT